LVIDDYKWLLISDYTQKISIMNDQGLRTTMLTAIDCRCINGIILSVDLSLISVYYQTIICQYYFLEFDTITNFKKNFLAVSLWLLTFKYK